MRLVYRSLIGLIAALAAMRAIAADPKPKATDGSAPILRKGTFALTDADRSYWAFQPVKLPAVPRVRKPSLVANPIDAFLLARLEAKKLSFNPPATKRELIRRGYFDLVGLPPAPEEVAAFEADSSPKAWEALVDRLLASPHYGERWARHWLDLVRFAESNGYERDGEKPHAWRYRDYVIESFNQDKPYDQFVREQLAGDEIADERMGSAAVGSLDWQSAIIATGFFRLHVWDDEPDSTVAAEFDDLDDIMVSTGTAFLGLTLGCARCHDHKFDPISQSDYYSLLSFIRNIDPYGQHHTGGGGRGTGKITRPIASPAEIHGWESAKAERVKLAEALLAKAVDSEEKKKREEELKRARDEAPGYAFALSIAENGGKSKATHILLRGRADSPGAEVSPAFPSVLDLPTPTLPPRTENSRTTGRRLVLADWIASPSNPLTARVLVNRLWQHHFGSGLVRTPDDFGRTGIAPTHPELLDWLAAELVSHGWSIKHLHRLILMSHAYRMSSHTDNRAALAVDESNEWLWHQNLRRVESEVIRDSMLSISGQLNTRRGGPSVFATLPKEVHTTQDSAGKGWSDSSPEEQNRRSLYLFVKRALKMPFLETFDFANCTSPMGVRPVTTIAPQALMALNDPFVHAQADALAERLRHEVGEAMEAQIRRGFRLALQRDPTREERIAAQHLLTDQSQRARVEGSKDSANVALKSFCLSLLNLNEFLYAD